jgi:putative Holliday junction resolvase
LRYLGIDYGTKRIGLALSDEAGDFSYPKEVVENGRGTKGEEARAKIADFCARENVGAIVVGESRDYKGNENLIMPEAREFAEKLSTFTKLPFFWEPEFMTSAQAVHEQGENKMLDASAASLILASFLEKKKKSTS